MKKRALPLSEVYRLLEPGPVVLMTTAHKGRHNVMTMSWHTMMEFEPPLIGCVISDRDYSFAALKATKECVIAIPSLKLASKVVRAGNTSGRTVDKFKTIGFTAVPASQVQAPLIGECFANLECRIVDTSMVKKYDFFVLEVVKAWIDPSQRDPKTIHHRGRGAFMVSGKTILLPSNMR